MSSCPYLLLLNPLTEDISTTLKMVSKIIITLFIHFLSTDVYSQEKNDSISLNYDSLKWETLLQSVTIKGQRQLIKTDIDRIGYDVQADETSKTDNLLEMLRKVPMVSLDEQDNIRIKGNSNYKIYKNGHPDPSWSKNAKEIFRSMPASMVKRIEVITDPGAREDAEGVNAILNIVMIEGKGVNGITGILSTTYTDKGQFNGNGYLTSQIGKTIISVDYGYNKMSKKSTSSHKRSERQFKDTGNYLFGNSDSSNPGYLHYADIDASYEVDSLNLLTATFGGYFYNLDVIGNGSTMLSDNSGSLLYSYDNYYHLPDYNHHSWNGRIDFEHKTHRNGERLTISYMLSLTRERHKQENIYSNPINVPFQYNSTINNQQERFTENTFQVDWFRPLSKNQKIDMGMKYINRINSSHQMQTYEFGGNQEEGDDRKLKHTTQVYATYVDYMYIHDKWSARAGLRYEHTFMNAHFPDKKAKDFSHHLNDWVPQASIKYQISDGQSIKLNYSSSISRPGIEYLNPGSVVTPFIIEVGNPSLTSSLEHNILVMYMFVGNRLTLQLTPAYNFSNNGIGIINTASDNIKHSTYENSLQLRRWRLDGYIQWKPFDMTTLVANINTMYTTSLNPSLCLKQKGLSTFYYISATQNLPWKLTLTASAYGQWGHSPNNVYGYSRSYNRYGIAIQKSFLDEDRLAIRLRVSNLFSKWNRNESLDCRGDYTGRVINDQVGRMFVLSASFRFGKLKAKVKKTESTIDNNDIVGGISKSK